MCCALVDLRAHETAAETAVMQDRQLPCKLSMLLDTLTPAVLVLAAGCQVVRVLEPPACFPADYLARDKDHLALLAWETVQVGQGVVVPKSIRHFSCSWSILLLR
jgi:hypothetical protein